jgi:hypothetical protein
LFVVMDGEKVAVLRCKQDQSRQELAEVAGLAYSTVGSVEGWAGAVVHGEKGRRCARGRGRA